MNVVFLLMIVFSLFVATIARRQEIEIFITCLTVGLMIVMGLNYILFGSVTVWHKTESKK